MRTRAAGLLRPRFWAQVVIFGTGVGLAAPILDMLLRSTSLEPAYEDPAKLGAVLLGLLSGYLGWYAIYLAALVVPAALLTATPPAALAGVAALFSAIHAYQPFEGTPLRVWAATAALSLIILVAARRSNQCESGGGKASMLGLVMGAVVLEAFLFHWATRFPLRDWARSEPALFILIYGIVVVATALAAVRFASKRAVGAAMAAGLLMLAWKPVEKLYQARYLDASMATQAELSIPRVIFIVVDTLRADALRYRNPEAPPTPNIDALAAESVIFENAVSPAPWTFPAMNSLLTGVAPYVDREDYTYPTAPLPTMSDWMLEAGYRTALVSGNELLDRPLNVVSGILEADVYAPISVGTYRTARAFWEANRGIETEANTAAVTSRSIEWIRDNGDAPFFLWAHYFDPHAPYAPAVRHLDDARRRPTLDPPYEAARMPENERDMYVDYYRAEVQLVDEHIGRLLGELREKGLYDESLIVLTSDHGEEFWEHGGTLHDHSLYQELLHVPLLIRLPGGANGNRRVSGFAPTQALLPTVLELAGIPHEPQPGWVPPLTPLVRGEADEYRHPIVSAGTRRQGFQRSVIVDGAKYMSWLDSGREAVFDLEADPEESLNVADQRPEIVARAREALGEHERLAASIRQEHGLEISAAGDDPAMLEKLKSLGYIQ